MSAEKLNRIDALVEKDIADKKLPGAVVLVGHKGKIVFRKAYGSRALVPAVEKMTVDTIFDVASLTKVVATTTSVMILVERGQLRLNDTIGKYIPEIQDKDVRNITIQQLLTHVSGFAPDFDLREKWTGREGMQDALKKERLRQVPGTKFVYSDINFIVLGEIVQRISGLSLSTFAAQNIFDPLKASDSNFVRRTEVTYAPPGINVTPTDPLTRRIAPTENIKGQQSYLGGQPDGKDGDKILRGEVHDPTSYRMGGVAGHAGLFSTADDLARFCQMLLNGGILDGKRILSAGTVARMTAPIVVSEEGVTRGLGWDMNTGFSSNRGELFPLGSFGHTGFTGTSIWIDRVSQTFVVFLSNRVHPDGKGDVTPLRAKVATVVASAIEDTPIEVVRLAEGAYYWSQVAAQIPKFREQAEAAKRTAANGEQASANADVLNGIDVLEKNNFKQLDGLRVGLITNHTGRDRAGIQTIDVLKAAPNVKLTALFAPEHGIRGLADEKVSDSMDEKTGLPIYSLYGETRRPKPEQLKDLDALVFDIQDVGVRFYTYMATLKNVMEEAGKVKLKVFVLDRPNPIGGVDVEGPVADADKLSFVVTHTTTARHGMTAGEWAMMVNAENKLNCDLTVIKMEGWNRGQWFDRTGQAWVNPSPNMRSLTEATLYPGVGLLETTNISVGRGTDTPFEVIGAPWMNGDGGQKLASYLNSRNLPGVRFVPVNFKPNASVFKDQDCGGVNIIVIDRARFRSVRTGIEIAAALQKLFPGGWKTENFNRLLANQATYDMVRQGMPPEDIEKAWQPGLEDFLKRRARFLLY
ncbi:MAG TPA: exo-beta-N-acetylmuramidase NamZ domain-containing protein [Pyrinomonadaceae bacterium]|jgi:uncharacterized protein YbbC (DUF1343 family)|nr:exo-beta-N-acetylmuramidase NamZ domain-containing protein [Pyrinomonadaceae bacterium]